MLFKIALILLSDYLWRKRPIFYDGHGLEPVISMIPEHISVIRLNLPRMNGFAENKWKIDLTNGENWLFARPGISAQTSSNHNSLQDKFKLQYL